MRVFAKVVGETGKWSTLWARRAAVMHMAERSIEQHLKAQDQLQRGGGLGDPAKLEQWARHIKAIGSAVATVKALPAAPGARLSGQRASARGCSRCPKTGRWRWSIRWPLSRSWRPWCARRRGAGRAS